MARDADGTIWRAVLLFGKADLEAAGNSWGLPNWMLSDTICPWCRANRSNLPLTDHRASALWRPTELMLTKVEFCGRMRQNPLHPLVEHMSKFFVRVDTMRTIDCKGVASSVFGSILVILVRHERRLGTNQDRRIEWLNRDRFAYYSRCHVSSRFPDITKNNLFSGGDEQSWAELHGPTIKASVRPLE